MPYQLFSICSQFIFICHIRLILFIPIFYRRNWDSEMLTNSVQGKKLITSERILISKLEFFPANCVAQSVSEVFLYRLRAVPVEKRVDQLQVLRMKGKKNKRLSTYSLVISFGHGKFWKGTFGTLFWLALQHSTSPSQIC